MKKSRFGLRAAAAGGLVAAISVAFPMLPAVGARSPGAPTVQVQGKGTLLAKGSGARINIRFSCPAGQTASIGVEISQATGRKVARGNGYRSFNCNGRRRDVTIDVLAFDAPFKKGSAFARADLYTGFVSRSKTGTVTLS